MKRIIFTRANGVLSVMTPAINTHPERENITEDEAVARALAKMPADAVGVQVVDESAIPTDRTFRNAWVASGATVVHDMVKARNIHRDALRALRKAKLEALDIAYQRADEDGNVAAKAAIAAKKRALRDVTSDPAIEAAATPEALKAVLPEALR